MVYGTTQTVHGITGEHNIVSGILSSEEDWSYHIYGGCTSMYYLEG